MTLTVSFPCADPATPDPRLDDRIGTDDPAAPTTADRLLISFGSSARSLFAGLGRSDAVHAVLDRALSTFDCSGVGVVLAEESQPMSAGASDESAAAADRLQISLRQGPVFQTIDRGQPVLVTELRSDSRWRFWAPMAADLGFRSALSLPLVDGDIAGSLTLYARSASRFRTADLAPAMVFAQLASIAIAVAQERAQLLRAVRSRSIVGQAQGILMEHYGVTAPQALTVLHRYSARQNLNLRTDGRGRHPGPRTARDRASRPVSGAIMRRASAIIGPARGADRPVGTNSRHRTRAARQPVRRPGPGCAGAPLPEHQSVDPSSDPTEDHVTDRRRRHARRCLHGGLEPGPGVPCDEPHRAGLGHVHRVRDHGRAEPRERMIVTP